MRRAEASETAIRRLAPDSAYLHCATHGFFAATAPETSPEAPSVQLAGFVPLGTGRPDPLAADATGYHPGLLSGIALAGANRGARSTGALAEPSDDGILTALEVAELNLAGTRLAVLSACDTGLGKPAGGEGLLGLQRAFAVAGAQTVVASLWQVDDQATATLMTEFYNNLWKKRLGRLEALRQAQLSMLLLQPGEGLDRARPDPDRPRSRRCGRPPAKILGGLRLERRLALTGPKHPGLDETRPGWTAPTRRRVDAVTAGLSAGSERWPTTPVVRFTLPLAAVP